MLTQQQMGFALDILKEISQGQAYMNHYNVKSMAVADVCASQLLRIPKMQAYLKELRQKAETPAIADLTERMVALTEVVRQKIPDKVQARDRISAVAELNKVQGSYPPEKSRREVEFIITHVDKRSELLGDARPDNIGVIEGEVKQLEEG